MGDARQGEGKKFTCDVCSGKMIFSEERFFLEGVSSVRAL